MSPMEIIPASLPPSTTGRWRIRWGGHQRHQFGLAVANLAGLYRLAHDARDRRGQGAACHTGRRSCFYRRIIKGELEFIDNDKLFDPEFVYGK